MRTFLPILAAFGLVTTFAVAAAAYAGPRGGETTTEVPAAMTPSEHEAAALHYEEEAVELRAKSAQHARTAEQYEDFRTGPRDLSRKMQKHCERLSAQYAEAAREAEQLAQLHRELAATRGE